jgi:hypothetical protein
MRASRKVPAEERPTKITASGLQAAREAAGLTREELAELSNSSVGVIAGIENGGRYHLLTISRASSGLPPPHNDLRFIRDE